MKWLCRRLCGVRSVRVIYGSGQVLYLSPRTTVEEVLLYYPHHFLCQSGLNSYSGWRSNQMLPMDTVLQSGSIYFLFPLPRLFPTAASLSSQSCRCYQSQNSSILAKDTLKRIFKHIQSPTCRSSLIFFDSPRKVEGPESPSWSNWSVKSSCKNSKSKVSPESNLYSAGRCDVALMPTPLQLPWRPQLGCISEDDDLGVSLEDVKQKCGTFWKRDTVNQAANKAPLSQRAILPSLN